MNVTERTDQRVADAILQQISILDSHTAGGEWSADFVREHALMIVQLAQSALHRSEPGAFWG
jgi:hypothetical protein